MSRPITRKQKEWLNERIKQIIEMSKHWGAYEEYKGSLPPEEQHQTETYKLEIDCFRKHIVGSL